MSILSKYEELILEVMPCIFEQPIYREQFNILGFFAHICCMLYCFVHMSWYIILKQGQLAMYPSILNKMISAMDKYTQW
jgi:hypothetical protein